MTVIDSFKIALGAIATNTLRSILTTLGIVIGVGSVIVMVAVGSGARSEVDKRIANLGTNMLMVFPGSSRIGGRSSGSGTTRPLSEGDMAALRDKVSGVAGISGYLQGSAPVIFGGANWTTAVNGVHDQYFDVRDWGIEDGRAFTANEVRQGARLALVGKTLIEKLFQGANPIGQTIRIKNVPFQVIGILESKGQSGWGRDQDDVVVIPLTTGRGRIMGKSAVTNDQVGYINIKFDDATDLREAEEQVTNVLRERRRIQPGAEDDFNVRNLAEFIKARTAAQTTLSWLLGATAAISLIVGGIGIMNIMLVSVTERTREIGLRMAVGARRRDILTQFLVEAVTLCMLGGLIGVALGIGAAFIAGRAAEWPIVISPQVVLVALAAAAGTGIFFGFFPARRAAHLNPIDALRSE
jgi:putative ABC transport system permease protein